MGGEPVGGDRSVNESADALTGVLIHDGADLDRPAVFVGVEREVHRPHHVRCDRRRRVRDRRADALAPPPLRDPEALVAPQPLDLLMVDRPALPAGVVVRPVVLPPGVLLRAPAQPVPQGLEVSLSQLLERRLLQFRLREQPLQARVLLLELLQPLRVVGLQAAVLVPPPVVRLPTRFFGRSPSSPSRRFSSPKGRSKSATSAASLRHLPHACYSLGMDIPTLLADLGSTPSATARATGLARTTIQRMRAGVTSPTLETLRELALAAGYDLDVALVPASDPAAAVAARVIADPADTGSSRSWKASDWRTPARSRRSQRWVSRLQRQAGGRPGPASATGRSLLDAAAPQGGSLLRTETCGPPGEDHRDREQRSRAQPRGALRRCGRASLPRSRAGPRSSGGVDYGRRRSGRPSGRDAARGG